VVDVSHVHPPMTKTGRRDVCKEWSTTVERWRARENDVWRSRDDTRICGVLDLHFAFADHDGRVVSVCSIL